MEGRVCYQSTWGSCGLEQAGEQPSGLVGIDHEDVSPGLVAQRVHGVV